MQLMISDLPVMNYDLASKATAEPGHGTYIFLVIAFVSHQHHPYFILSIVTLSDRHTSIWTWHKVSLKWQRINIEAFITQKSRLWFLAKWLLFALQEAKAPGYC